MVGMETKIILLNVLSEYDVLVLAARFTPERQEKLLSRMALAGKLDESDDVLRLAFFDMDFDVYEETDLLDLLEEKGDGLRALVSEEDLKKVTVDFNPERLDFGNLIVENNYAYFQFGIKHVPTSYETTGFTRDFLLG